MELVPAAIAGFELYHLLSLQIRENPADDFLPKRYCTTESDRLREGRGGR